MKKIASFFRDGTAEEWLGRILISVVIIPVVINILNREFFTHYSLTLESIALLAYVGIGYAMFGYLYKKDDHVDVRFVTLLLPPFGQKIVELFRDIFIFAYSVFMTYWGIKLALANLNRTIPATDICYSWGYILITIGGISGAIRSFWALISRLFKKKESKEDKR